MIEPSVSAVAEAYLAGRLLNIHRRDQLIIPLLVSRTKLIEDSKRPQPRYRGLVHGASAIVRDEGLGGIYRGLLPVVSAEWRGSVPKRAALTDRPPGLGPPVLDDAPRRQLGGEVLVLLDAETVRARQLAPRAAVAQCGHVWHWRTCRDHHRLCVLAPAGLPGKYASG